jgi:hypothetical protein
MRRVGIRVGEDGDRAEAQRAAGPEHAARDLAPVRDEDASDHEALPSS